MHCHALSLPIFHMEKGLHFAYFRLPKTDASLFFSYGGRSASEELVLQYLIFPWCRCPGMMGCLDVLLCMCWCRKMPHQIRQTEFMLHFGVSDSHHGEAAAENSTTSVGFSNEIFGAWSRHLEFKIINSGFPKTRRVAAHRWCLNPKDAPRDPAKENHRKIHG